MSTPSPDNTMYSENKYIRFDWAAKRMLRDKANFAVLEGLITVLIGEAVHIIEILESEGNQESADDKYNRVDIKALNSKGEIIIVDVQLSRQLFYMQRILYGVSKAITEHIAIGDMYEKVKKVYSISILYFDLGQGDDYLYHGETNFTGVHTHDQLSVSTRMNNRIVARRPAEIFPEYYIILVNRFNDVARTPIEEWLDYLKNNRIGDDTCTPGLKEARERLRLLSMSAAERQNYDRHMEEQMIENDELNTAKLEGWEKGIEQGREQGREQGEREAKRQIALAMMQQGLPAEQICRLTGLTADELVPMQQR